MLSAILLLVIAAFVLTLASASGKVALWVPVLLLTLVELLRLLPT